MSIEAVAIAAGAPAVKGRSLWVDAGYRLIRNRAAMVSSVVLLVIGLLVLFAPYLILTITSELWPSSQDWRGARWLVGGILILAIVTIVLLWYTRYLVFNDALLHSASSIATYIDFALIVLVALDIIFLVIAEVILQLLRR